MSSSISSPVLQAPGGASGEVAAAAGSGPLFSRAMGAFPSALPAAPLLAAARILGAHSRTMLIVALTTSAITYVLFQMKVLPKPVARVVSKLLFYPTMPITALLRTGNYWTPVDDTLVLGCAPLALLRHPEALSAMGVRAVVNMCEEYGGPQSAYKRLKMKQLRLPTVDHFEPSASQLREAVTFIEQQRAAGHRVYVHCKAGHGRAASVALAWMLYTNPDMSGKDANALLRGMRKVRGALYQQRNVVEFQELLVAEGRKGGSAAGAEDKKPQQGSCDATNANK